MFGILCASLSAALGIVSLRRTLKTHLKFLEYVYVRSGTGTADTGRSNRLAFN